ncbi:MAG: YdcF family protein, partial [Gammaproteobacteria bacterium]|nr:YdcF family protein [Gammaproteobacteria bacterium]
SFKESAFGWDGLSTFIFSNVIMMMTLGLAFTWLFGRALKIARDTDTTLLNKKNLLIAGLRLENDQPTEEFKARLNRVVALFSSMPNSGEIIILGGLTGGNTISEAQAGGDYLVAQGVDEKAIVLEDQSRHTLENLQNARVLLEHSFAKDSTAPIDSEAVIISSRYHLYRIITLAKGLNMALEPIAAEDCFRMSFLNFLRLLKEAYYLHWYWSGKLWVYITANKKS